MPCRTVEWRLPCQMNCRKGGQRPCTALCGSSAAFPQITARAYVPCRPVEWRLPCKMNCSKGECRACTAVCGRSVIFLQTIARADVPWSAVWRGSRCSMDTNRCHRAGGCALEAPRMAIAVPDELQERGTKALYGHVCQVCVLLAKHRACRCALERCLEGTAAR